MALMNCLGITNPYSLRDFIAINAINHTGAIDKHINQSLYQSLSNFSIGGYLVGATPVSFISIPCFLDRYQSLSIGTDEEHTYEVDSELHQFGVVCG